MYRTQKIHAKYRLTMKKVKVLVAQSWWSLQPHGLSMKFSRQEYWSGLPILFSMGSSWPRVSCIAGRFFTNWATREDPPQLLTSREKQGAGDWLNHPWPMFSTNHSFVMEISLKNPKYEGVHRASGLVNTWTQKLLLLPQTLCYAHLPWLAPELHPFING